MKSHINFHTNQQLQSLESPSLDASIDSSKQQHPTPPTHDGGHAAVGHAEHEEGGGHSVERYPITTIDFSRVETPFIIGIWILFASIAKIGE